MCQPLAHHDTYDEPVSTEKPTPPAALAPEDVLALDRQVCFALSVAARNVVAASFTLGAAAIALLTVSLPLGVLLAFVAVVGLGTSGTQILIYGFVATYYRTNVRSAGVAWCAGFGRLGGIGGPLIGGLLVASGIALNSVFHVLTVLAVVGALLTLLVPTAETRHTRAVRRTAPVRLAVEPGDLLARTAE